MTKIIPLLVLTLFMNSCSTTKTIYVADSYVDCENDKSQKCLQVKENMEDDWILIQNGIVGFDYKEGFTHKIEVEISKEKNASNDEKKLKYKLIKIIYQEKSKTNQDKMNLNGSWKVLKLVGIDTLSKSPTLIIDFDTKKISGNAGCNSYGTTFSINGEQLKFETPFATKMYCTNMNIEKAFFSCLQNTSYFEFVDGKLKLYAKDGVEQMLCIKN